MSGKEGDAVDFPLLTTTEIIRRGTTIREKTQKVKETVTQHPPKQQREERDFDYLRLKERESERGRMRERERVYLQLDVTE